MSPVRLAVILTCAGTALAAVSAEGAPPPLAVVPQPTTVVPSDGIFTLTSATVVVANEASRGEATRLAESLRPATGLPLPVVASVDGRPAITLDSPVSGLVESREQYSITVTSTGITIYAPFENGLFYGGQTLRQLLPPAAFSPTPVRGVTWSLPAIHIDDRPAFPWRGMHLDCARHFFPVSFVKRYIDLLAMHKMNVFHWHLTDDQGWRLQIKKYPRLADVGSRRAGSSVPDPDHPGHLKFDAVPYGGFYTQDQVRDVVAYAAARHVTVVPEIEMPGHSAAAIAAYPWLGVSGQPIEVRTKWGVEPHLLNPSPETVAFYQDVLTEVMALFPSPYIHCGGDEAPKGEWDHSPAVQARIRSLGLKDSEAMQAWFMGQMDQFLTRHGRHLIGWDEILAGGLTPGAAVMSWRGDAGAFAAATQHHDAVNASNGYTYFDHYQSTDHAREPFAIGGYLPLSKVYEFQPVPPKLGEGGRRFVLGGQGQVWTEYIATPQQAEYMAYPRAAALAEVLWSNPAHRDFADFRGRLAVDLQRLDAMGVNYRKLDPTP